MERATWILYGANGYTGELIAREAVRRGIWPTLAGRNRDKIEALGKELDCPTSVFALDDVHWAADELRDHTLVLNCAGPFSRTAIPMVEACLIAGTHYLDITGEIDVLEELAARHETAKTAGIGIVPAVGFDVVPTDCLARMLADDLPDATHLTLAFTGIGGMSPGTAKTMLEGLTRGVRARRDGRIVAVPDQQREIAFPDGPHESVLLPWGDVSTAYRSTGIPHIDTYMAPPPREAALLRYRGLVRTLAKFAPLRALLNKAIESGVKGPSTEERQQTRTTIWGEVRNARGETKTAALETPSGYALTVLTALAAVERMLHVARHGFATPSQAFGKEFILQIPGVRKLDG